MKTILVNTSHNISIKYELATLLHRSLAFFLDFLLFVAYALSTFWIFGSLTTLYYVFMVIIPLLYHFLCEVFFNGQSLGKRLIKIRVVNLNGKKPSTESYFLRWIFRTIEITSTLGVLAAINIASSEKSQRLGDIMAGTTVIKELPGSNIDLKVITGLHEKKREIVYPGVTRYTDKDMLLVKETIARLKRNPHVENKRFAIELADRIADDLNVTIEKGKRAVFLEDVLIDYIFLTR